MTKYIPQIKITDSKQAVAIVVGPPVMMKFSTEGLLNVGFAAENIWISQERKMCCGIGKCGHCKIDDVYVCLDGPVFNFTKRPPANRLKRGRTMDINTKKLKKNAFRVTKHRGLTASRIRVPGGHLEAKYLSVIQHIAEAFGNGTVHLTSRQGFEIPGIKFADMPNVNQLLHPVITGLDINQQGVGQGYNAAGTRNVTACIGNKVCPYACYDTTVFAKQIEKVIFPNDLHVKIALTGCPNDCAKVRMHDFGIIGMTVPQYSQDRCVSCGACVRACMRKSVNALSTVNYKVIRNHEKCIGCGECVLNCPTLAWTRSQEKYYRLTIFGRTGKKNPRLGEDVIKWADQNTIITIICNTYEYVACYIDRNAAGGKEHIGYIVDRTGFEEFKKWALKDVKLAALAEVAANIYWKGIKY